MKIVPVSHIYCHFWIKNNQKFVSHAVKKMQKNLIWINEIHSRNDAILWIGKELYVQRQQIPQTEGSYLFHDLVGLQALDLKKSPIGQVTGVFNFGACDIIELNNTQLIPFTKTCILSISLEHGIIVCDIPKII